MVEQERQTPLPTPEPGPVQPEQPLTVELPEPILFPDAIPETINQPQLPNQAETNPSPPDKLNLLEPEEQTRGQEPNLSAVSEAIYQLLKELPPKALTDLIQRLQAFQFNNSGNQSLLERLKNKGLQKLKGTVDLFLIYNIIMSKIDRHFKKDDGEINPIPCSILTVRTVNQLYNKYKGLESAFSLTTEESFDQVVNQIQQNRVKYIRSKQQRKKEQKERLLSIALAS